MLMVHLSGKCFQSSAFEWDFQISLKHSWFQGRVTQRLFLPKYMCFIQFKVQLLKYTFYKNQIYYLFCFCTCSNWQTKKMMENYSVIFFPSGLALTVVANEWDGGSLSVILQLLRLLGISFIDT